MSKGTQPQSEPREPFPTFIASSAGSQQKRKLGESIPSPCIWLPLFLLLGLFPFEDAGEWDLESPEKRELERDPCPANPHSLCWDLQVVVATAISGGCKMPRKYHMQIVGEIQQG